ncbi:Ribosomal protein L11 methyltransferase (PrmA) [Geosmithia morbida]|uniref:Ribosomal protein L11 methyltransferase (PrmA) n=1 Tax=Geosmithia morbida TaxID=1094350 RepID=A0A9P4Z1D4_9HYPO|nr:Ribosomal protein L11 methyltransferase (PrmA) [Geosmithia morbida]KAF4126906.1 Ribosomal protein L11 methyltransferase (PrmA) [Geosmithia morbida]
MSRLAKAYSLTSTNDTKDLYDKWASTYDSEMSREEEDYVGPALAAAHILQHLGAEEIGPDVEILDAGCGTGLAGIALSRLGARKVDGVDLSPGMLDVARKAGVYRHLDTADLSTRLVHDDDRYDVVCCVGTLTQAHVGPVVLDEFVRIVKPGGYIVATILGSIYVSGGYEAKIESLVNRGKAKLISAEMEDYRRKANIRARMVVIQVV